MTIWLTKLLLSHLLTDFLLQRSAWIRNRNKNHFFSPYLYLHTVITAGLAWLFIGWQYWMVALIIFITHTLIDGAKSYAPDKPKYFLLDQAAWHGFQARYNEKSAPILIGSLARTVSEGFTDAAGGKIMGYQPG